MVTKRQFDTPRLLVQGKEQGMVTTMNSMLRYL
jgi:hypothetical protein